MEIKILQVFYGKDGLPYKDKDRQVHFPITGTGFLGASNTTKIKFYYEELDNLDETTWVAISKLPNGKIGSRVLESYLDDELNEHYALLELDNYYTQYKGDVFISLQGYQGGVNLDFNEETQQYEIHGTPTIAATGSIKFTINYAPQFVGSGETDNVNFQRILADLGTKLGIRATSEHVEELPEEGNPNIFYVVNDDSNNPNLANIYIWNSETRHYIWVGDNTLDLGAYYTKDQGESFEEEIDNRVSNVENELSSVAQGSPKGIYSSVEDLTAAYPDGSSNIYLVGTNWYYWDGAAWTSGGTYMSSLPDKYLDQSSNNTVENKVVSNALDDISAHFEKGNVNYFNKFNYIKEIGLYLNASSEFVSYDASLIVTVRIDGTSGQVFHFNNFDAALAAYSIVGLKLFTTNSIPADGVSVIENFTSNTNTALKRGNASLTTNATYLNILYQFDTREHLLSYLQNIANGLVVLKALSYATEYVSYYKTVEQSKGDSVPKTRTIAGISLENDITKDALNKATGTYEIKEQLDEITTYFEPSNVNLFNKFDYKAIESLYLRDSDFQYIAFDSSLIFTIEVNGTSGNQYAFNNFNADVLGVNLSGLKAFSSNTVPAIGNSIVELFAYETINTQLKRGVVTFTNNAKYLNIQFLFADKETMLSYIEKIVQGLVVLKGGEYAESYVNYYLTVAESVAGDNNWKGKTIWWCGTSIPEGVDPNSESPYYHKSYPEIVGLLVKAKAVYNKALGASMCRANVRTGNYVNALSYNLMYSLSQTAEEKQNLIDNWQTIRQSLIDPNTFPTLDGSQQAIINGATFEERLLPYLDGTYGMPDLFVIDHGHNDFKSYYTLPNGSPDIGLEPTVENIQNGVLAEDTYMTANNYYNLKRFLGDLSHIPSGRFNEFIASINRNCYKGAINFICTVILYHNPRARIVFIGNIESWEKQGLVDAQENNANSWQFPLIKVWEYLGLSHHIVPGSYNYWGGARTTDYDVKQIYCPDNVHPHSDTSGETIEKYALIIADKLKHIAV